MGSLSCWWRDDEIHQWDRPRHVLGQGGVGRAKMTWRWWRDSLPMHGRRTAGEDRLQITS